MVPDQSHHSLAYKILKTLQWVEKLVLCTFYYKAVPRTPTGSKHSHGAGHMRAHFAVPLEYTHPVRITFKRRLESSSASGRTETGEAYDDLGVKIENHLYALENIHDKKQWLYHSYYFRTA